MFQKHEGGITINIQGLQCNLPPIGYVYNSVTKQLEQRDIYARSEVIEEQYWERVPPPHWYKETMKRWDKYERTKKDTDEDFYDEELEEFKKQEWDRRLNGFWFWNYDPIKKEREAIYLTGANYLFLQWMLIDIGIPKFRFPDLEYFYFQQYCIEDPLSMGMIEITKRRFGKTYRGGAFLLDYITRTKWANGGIQSKTGGDAKKVFAKAVIPVFKSLPRFFRPEYDMSLGITPKTEIRFQQTNVRGKKAEEGLEKDELNSMIDFQSADKVGYDGQKLVRYFGDEFAKTTETDVYERHDVIRYCLLDDENNIIGKALYSSTVEQLETEKDGVSEAAILLWNDSDQLNKGANGRTPSGLYRFFMTAQRARNFNIYGFPDEEKTLKEILADRETVKHNQRAWAARVRKEPLTIDEAFYAGNDKCEFNAEAISNQIKELQDKPVFLRRCRLVKETKTTADIFGNKTTKEEVHFMDDARGGWLLYQQPEAENNYTQYGSYMEPQNTFYYSIGVDTTKDDFATHGSKPTICVMKRSNIEIGEESGMYPVAFYDDKTRLDVHFDDEVLKACMWYGCKVNYEIDARTDFYKYFLKMDASEMLEWTPKFAQDPVRKKTLEPGTRSGNPYQLAAQLQAAKMYIDGTDPVVYNGFVHKIVFSELLKQLLKYDHSARTKFDQCIALFMALLPMMGQQTAQQIRDSKPKEILPTYAIKSYV